MVVDNPERLTTFEISRPIIGGFQGFLDKAQLCSNEVFGTEATTFVEAPGSHPDTKRLIGVQSSRTSISDSRSARLILFERYAPEKMRLHGSFRNAVDELEQNADPFFEYVGMSSPSQKPPNRGLEATLRRIGLRYDIPDQDSFRVRLDGVIQKSGLPGKNLSLEFALTPAVEDEATAMLFEQSEVCIRALAHHGRKSVYPTSGSSINVPFAEIPADTEPGQRAEFLEVVKGYLPIAVVLGSLSINQARQFDG